MAKLKRKLHKVFGGQGLTNDFSQIGSQSDGDPVKTKDIDLMQKLQRYSQGLAAITQSQNSSNVPYLEDLNSILFLMSRQIAYGFQAGVPEWDENTEYFANSSLVLRDGALYIAQTGTDETPNVGNIPSHGEGAWELLVTGGGGGGDTVEVTNIINSRRIGDVYSSLRSSAADGELQLSGQVIDVASYTELVNSTYVGDSDNATADFCYRCDNIDGSSRSVTGAYFKLPDARGLTAFGIGANGDTSRANGQSYSETHGYRLDQLQGHLHEFDQHTVGVYNGDSALGTHPFYGISPSADPAAPLVGAPTTDNPRGPVRFGDTTQSAGFGVYWYVKATEAADTQTGEGLPVGATYMQLPGKGSPDILDMAGTWSNISSSFEDRFLRIDGQATADFDNGGLQDSQHNNVITVQTSPAEDCHQSMDSIEIPEAGPSSCLSSGLHNPLIHDDEHDHRLSFSKTGTEDRPANVTIRIWERIA